MLLFKPVAIQTHEGWYLSVGQELHGEGFVESQTEIYSARVKSTPDARVWFKSKIAEFLHKGEEDMTPLWWWMMPKELQ